MVLFHLSYISDKEHSKAVRGWLIIPTVISHLGEAAGVPGTVSTAAHLSFPRVPSMIKRCFATKLLWKGLSRSGGRDEPTHSHLLSSLPNKCMVGLQGDEASPLHRPCSLVSQMISWSVGQLVSFEHSKNWIWAYHIPYCCDYKKSNPTFRCTSNEKAQRIFLK